MLLRESPVMTNITADECPACGAPVTRVAVDIGVGTQYGPAQCTQCVWQEPEAVLDFLTDDEDELPW